MFDPQNTNWLMFIEEEDPYDTSKFWDFNQNFFQEKTAESTYFLDDYEDDHNNESLENVPKEDLIEKESENILLEEGKNLFPFLNEKMREIQYNDKLSNASVFNASFQQWHNHLNKQQTNENASFELSVKKKYKAGRLKKGIPKPVKNYHSKNRKDNIKNKIKIHFTNNIFFFTNGFIKGELCNRQNIVFRLPSHIEKKNTKIDINKQLLNERIKDVLVKYNVSKKYIDKEQSNENNLKRLQKIIDKNENKVILNEFLNTTVKEFYINIYYIKNIQGVIQKYKINREKNKRIQFLIEFKEEIKQKYKDKLYDEKFEKECNSFISEFQTKTSRKSKTKN